MDELACFAPGMLALGASGYNDPAEAKKFLTLAEEVKLWLDINRIFKQFILLELSPLFLYFSTNLQLAWTCYNFYESTPTKLAGENYFFNSGSVCPFLVWFMFTFAV